jgi:4-amino-4-deoxy-L-arabinose transferase-like glycosyltransferase
MMIPVIQRISQSRAGPYFLLAVIALVALFYQIGKLPFLGNDECRYARIADEMNQAGRWVTPTLQGYPWLEKPPLYYWITIPMYRLFGMSEASARLGPAFCALTAAAAIFWLGSMLWSRLAGVLGGTIVLTAVGFYAYGRSASVDMPLTACLTLALSLLAAAILKSDQPLWSIGCAYFFLGLAVLAKGPVSLLLAAGILLLFWTFDEQQGCFARMHVVSGAVISLAVAVPWHWLAFKENGFSFISSYLINHNFARYVTEVHHHEQPVLYFLPVMLGLFFPWSGWLPALVSRRLSLKALDPRTWDRRILLLGCWIIFPFLFFSLSSSMLPGYVLPSIPPLALLLGSNLAARIQNPGGFSLWRPMRWFYLIFALLAAFAIPIITWVNYEDAWSAGLFIGAAVLLPAWFAFQCARSGNLRRAVQVTAVQGILILLVAAQFGFKTIAEYNSAHDIAARAMAERAAGEPIITFACFEYTLHYYTGYRVGTNFVDPAAMLEFAQGQPRFLVVTTEQLARDVEKMPELSVTRLASQGNLRLLRARLIPRM